MGLFWSKEYSKPKDLDSKLFPEYLNSMPSMRGKVVVITGCTTGLGFTTAKAVAEKGASVALLNRESTRATSAEEEVRKVATQGAKVVGVPCDMQDFASVREAAEKVKTEFPDGIDVLANNAGVMAVADKATKDGADVQMQVNHLSHFLLTQRLWPLLVKTAESKGDARVVHHSSGAAYMARGADAKYYGKNGGNLGGDESGTMPFSGPRWDRYNQSKLANVLFTYALRDKCDASGVKVTAAVAHPGIAATELHVSTVQDGGMSGSLANMAVSQTADDGAIPFLKCISDPNVRSGEFWGPPDTMGMPGASGPATLLPERPNAGAQGRETMWEESEKTTGVTFEI